MRWLMYVRIANCLLSCVSIIVSSIEDAKAEDGKIDAEEVLGIIDVGLGEISKCLIKIIK